MRNKWKENPPPLHQNTSSTISRRHSTEEMMSLKHCKHWSRQILKHGNLALQRKRMYNGNLFKAYALIWERCAKAMQNKLLAQSDYVDEIFKNLIKLLKAIKEHCIKLPRNPYQEVNHIRCILSIVECNTKGK